MKASIEGTYRLEGLIEATLSDSEQERQLHQWHQRCAAQGISLDLHLEGNAVSLLAEEDTKTCPESGTPLDELLAGLLDELLSIWPPEQRRELTSTLRSVEYREGVAVQTLYAVDSSGQLNVQQRIVQESTVPPAQPRSWRARLPQFGIALGVILLLLLLSLPFVPYGRLFRATLRHFRPLAFNEIAVNVGPFRGYLRADSLESSSHSKHIVLYLHRGERLPASPQELAGLWESASGMQEKLTVEALARRRIRCEFFDAERRWLGVQSCDVLPVPEAEATENASRRAPSRRDVESGPGRLALQFYLPRDTAFIRLHY